MSAAQIVRRIDPATIIKKRAMEFEAAKRRALTKKAERDGKAPPEFAPMADVIEIRIKLTPEEVDQQKARDARSKVASMLEFEATKKPHERQPMFEAYLDLCIKTGTLPDSATVSAYERFTRSERTERE